MFGLYRTLLALAVLFQHLADIPMVGHFAVYGFFVLSGYLMTSVMQETYGYAIRGRIAFGVNRFLRLFPSYWLLCLISLLLMAVWGESLTRIYQDALFVPRTTIEIVSNLTLIFPNLSPKWAEPRLAPPTWALTLELVFYGIIALGASRTAKRTLIWLAAGLAYVALTFVLELGHESRYSWIPAASLPFSIGSLIFHYRTPFARFADRIPVHPGLLVIAYLLLALQAPGADHILVEFFFFTNIGIHALIIGKLLQVTSSVEFRRFDKKIGDLSYPVYLGHYQMGFLVSMLFWGYPVVEGSGNRILAASLAAIATLVLAYLINRYLDRKIESLRRSIKKRHIQPNHSPLA